MQAQNSPSAQRQRPSADGWDEHARRRLVAVAVLVAVIFVAAHAADSTGHGTRVVRTAAAAKPRPRPPAPARHPDLRPDVRGQFFTMEGAHVVRLRAANPGNRVALIFDDGPGPETPKAIAALRSVRARATFFLIGRHAAEHPDVVKSLESAGMELGNHTWSHPAMPALDRRDQLTQVAAAQTEIVRVGMVRPRLFRPPDVLWNADTARAAADTHTLGVLHTVETNDYLRPGAQAIVRAAERAKPGGVIALHDAGGDRSGTIAAIRPIVRSLARRGLRAVTVGDLIGYPPPSRFALSGAKGDAAAGPS